MKFQTQLLAFTSLLSLASAHFTLNYPTTIGFSDDDEGTGPCGSFDITSRKTVTNFDLDLTPISLTSTHAAATWVIRGALLNNTNNLVTLMGTVDQDTLGNYCTQAAVIPDSWAGQDGVIQVVQKATDGLLYQCAAVKFTSGSFSGSLPSVCKNVTNIKVSYTTDNVDIPASNTTSSSTSQTTTATATAAASTTAASSEGGRNVVGMSFVVLAVMGGVAALLV